jgi:hypothetical protein
VRLPAGSEIVFVNNHTTEATLGRILPVRGGEGFGFLALLSS